MNDDYLWDKSGEPDEEIKEFEQMLGALRYQPKTLELDQMTTTRAHRHHTPLLAIAAALLVTILAVGLWLDRRDQASPGNNPPHVEAGNRITTSTGAGSWKSNIEPGSPIASNYSPALKPTSRNYRHFRKGSASGLSPRELDEAMKAKTQLLMALRLASEKLNLAQRKVQNPTNLNQIRNQHKNG